MLVYGDHREIADPVQRLHSLSRQLDVAAGMPAGIERHAKLVGALISAGQVQQGIADEGCSVPRLDRFVYSLAACVVKSWDSRLAELDPFPPVPTCDLPARVELRLPEGFAFYGVYP